MVDARTVRKSWALSIESKGCSISLGDICLLHFRSQAQGRRVQAKAQRSRLSTTVKLNPPLAHHRSRLGTLRARFLAKQPLDCAVTDERVVRCGYRTSTTIETDNRFYTQVSEISKPFFK